MTVGICFALGAVVSLWSSWDEFTCVAGETTSTGPCGIGLQAAGAMFLGGATFAILAFIVLERASRRPVDAEGGNGWRVGQGFLVIACGVLLGLMIPRYECPLGTTLSPVFRFCVSTQRSFRAPSTGLPWKFASVGLGIALGVLVIWWRSMPWWLASAVVIVVFTAAVLFTTTRTTGLPGGERRSYTIGLGAPTVVVRIPVASRSPPVIAVL